MADNISELSTTASSNGTIASIDVSGATGKVKDGDNVMRAMNAILAMFYDDLGGQNTVAGTANAITVTTSTLYAALASGMVIVFKAGSSNTGATTLNLDAIGAKAVRKIVGGSDVALGAGDILAGRYYTMVYSSAANAAAGGWIIVPAAQYLPDGTATDPALTFDNDANSGMYRIGSDNIGIALGGTKALAVSAGALDIPGTSAGASALVLHEDTDNGTNKVTVQAPASLSADATVTLPGTTGTLAIIEGTTTNDNAAAGAVGEIIESTVASGSAVALGQATAGDVTSISLTAGDWDVWGSVAFVPSAVPTTLAAWISTTSATLPTAPNAGAETVLVMQGSVFASANTQVLPAGKKRISIAATTTVYLSAYAAFGGLSCAAYGYIGARRAR